MEQHDYFARGLFIPFALFEDDRLSLREMLLIVVIDALDDDKRHCYATNEYLAQRLKCTENNVAKMLAHLREVDLVRVFDYKGQRALTTPLRIARDSVKHHIQVALHGTGENSSVHGKKFQLSTGKNSKSLNKEEYSEMNKERENALSIFKKHFPDVEPNLFQQDQILTLAADLKLWDKTCAFWKSNGYQGRHVGRLLDCYDNKNALPKENNGKPNGAIVVDDFKHCPICANGVECPDHPGGASECLNHHRM